MMIEMISKFQTDVITPQAWNPRKSVTLWIITLVGPENFTQATEAPSHILLLYPQKSKNKIYIHPAVPTHWEVTLTLQA